MTVKTGTHVGDIIWKVIARRRWDVREAVKDKIRIPAAKERQGKWEVYGLKWMDVPFESVVGSS
jgi:hypothetical protein